MSSEYDDAAERARQLEIAQQQREAAERQARAEYQAKLDSIKSAIEARAKDFGMTVPESDAARRVETEKRVEEMKNHGQEIKDVSSALKRAETGDLFFPNPPENRLREIMRQPNPEIGHTKNATIPSPEIAIVVGAAVVEKAAIRAWEAVKEAQNERYEAQTRERLEQEKRKELEKAATEQAKELRELERSKWVNDDDSLGRGHDKAFEQYLDRYEEAAKERILAEMQRKEQEDARQKETKSDDASRREREEAERRQLDAKQEAARQQAEQARLEAERQRQEAERQRQERDRLDKNSMPGGFREW